MWLFWASKHFTLELFSGNSWPWLESANLWTLKSFQRWFFFSKRQWIFLYKQSIKNCLKISTEKIIFIWIFVQVDHSRLSEKIVSGRRRLCGQRRVSKSKIHKVSFALAITFFLCLLNFHEQNLREKSPARSRENRLNIILFFFSLRICLVCLLQNSRWSVSKYDFREFKLWLRCKTRNVNEHSRVQPFDVIRQWNIFFLVLLNTSLWVWKIEERICWEKGSFGWKKWIFHNQR